MINPVRALLISAPLLIFMGLAIIFGLQLGKNPSKLPSALLDKPVPAFALPALNDAAMQVTHETLRQSGPVLLNVFASWCQPCWSEHAVVTRIAQSGVPVVGLAYKDKPEDTQRFLSRLGDPYQVVAVDQPGMTAIDLGVYGAPETYIIDAQGRIRYRHVGALTDEIVAQEIMPRLALVKETS